MPNLTATSSYAPLRDADDDSPRPTSASSGSGSGSGSGPARDELRLRREAAERNAATRRTEQTPSAEVSYAARSPSPVRRDSQQQRRQQTTPREAPLAAAGSAGAASDISPAALANTLAADTDHQGWIPPRDERLTTEAALDAWAKGVSKQAELLELRETPGLPWLDADGAKALVRSFNDEKLPGTLFDLATATARATVRVRERQEIESSGTAAEEGDGACESTTKSESATYFERGWTEAVEAEREDESIDEDAQGGERDEIAASLEQCPRLHLLSTPQLVSVLHMTDPQELNDMKLWRPMCNFDKIVLADSSAPAKFGDVLPRSVPKDVVAVEQCDREGEVVATLRLLEPHAQIFQHDFAETTDELNAPQAAWIEGLFGCIKATLQDQLARAMDKQGGSCKMCDMLQTAPDGGDQAQEKFCLQVVMLAFNIRISDILSEVLDEESEPDRAAAAAGQKRRSDAWAEALAVAEGEYEALQAARTDTVEDESLQAKLLGALVMAVGGAAVLLAKKQWPIRYRRDGEEVQVAMQVDSPESGGLPGEWRGCNYGWELVLQDMVLDQTAATFVVYKTSFENMPVLEAGRCGDPEKLHNKTAFVTGQAGTGKTETAKDYARWVVGTFYKVLAVGDTDADLGVYSKAQKHFPVVLMCDEANRAFSEGALRSATQRQRRMPGSLVLTYNPGFLGSIAADAEKLKDEIVKYMMGSAIEMPRPFQTEVEQRRFFELMFPVDQRVAVVLAGFFAAGAAARDKEAKLSAGKLTGTNRFFQLRYVKGLLSSMTQARFTDTADTSRDAMVFMFGHLGEHFTMVPTAAQTAMLTAAGGKRGRPAEPAKHMMAVLGEAVASRCYHLRLIRAVYSSSSIERQGIDAMLDQQLAAGRRIHAADLAALLCEFPDSALKIIRKIGLQAAEGTVGVGWPGTRRVAIDFTDVHISPSGEGAQGPAMLWAGKDASGLMGLAEPHQPERILQPQVVGFDGAVTTLELLPAIINSPVSAALLTCPAIDALIEAKWRLLRPFYFLEVVMFSLVFGMFVAHPFTHSDTARYLLVGASLSTIPLVLIEWRQTISIPAMSGVGAGRLSKRVNHTNLQNLLDISGPIMIWFTTVAHVQTGQPNLTTSSFTAVLLFCRLIWYFKVSRTLGFLLEVFVACVTDVGQYLIMLVFAVVAFAIPLHVQNLRTATPIGEPPSSNTSMLELAYGGRGLSGAQDSLWMTFLFAIVGDSDPATYYHAGMPMIVCFLSIEVLVRTLLYGHCMVTSFT